MRHLRYVIPLALPFLVAASSVEVARVDGANIQRPVWSPDGALLAWEAHHPDTQTIDLFMGDPGSRQFQRLGRRPVAGVAVAGFATTPTGRVAAEVSFSPVAQGRLVYTLSHATHDLDLHVEGVGVVASAPGADGGAAWSPDGRHIVFTSSRTGEGDLYLLDAAAIEAPPVRLTFSERSADVYATWSADSRSVAFVARGGEGDHIWRVELGGEPVQITRWPGSQLRPRYSPIDRWVAFYANPVKKERYDLYMMVDDPNGAPILLAEDVVPNQSGPQWTPDGRYVLYTHRDDEAFNPIGIVAVDSPSIRQTLPLDTVGHGDIAVVGLADGRWRLAYVAQGRATEQNLSFKRLYVADVPVP